MIFKTSHLILALSVIICLSCSMDKNEVVFTLEGEIGNNESSDIFLYQAKGLNANEYSVVDTLKVNSDGTFSASYSLEPHFYQLRINDSLEIPFIADSSQQIVVQVTSEGEYDVSGSADTDLFEEYEEYRMAVLSEIVYPIRGRLDDMLEEKDSQSSERIEQLGVQVMEAEENYRDSLLPAVKKMGKSIAIYPTMVRWDGDKHIEFYENLASEFSDQHKGLEVAELVSEKVRILKQVSIGGKVSDIIAENPSGEEKSLYNNLGTYTLVDFFGSWCGPCRSKSDHLVRMHEKFSNSGFQIFGFGIEFEEDRWVQALDQDNRTWTNVSTVDGYKSEIAYNYAITALPRNFLVDENGIILAKDIHGEELENKVSELLNQE